MPVTNMLLPDGREAVTLPNQPTRWSESVGAAELNLQADNPERSLFHVWSIDPDARRGGPIDLQLTPAGEAALAAYDPELEPSGGMGKSARTRIAGMPAGGWDRNRSETALARVA